MNTLRFARFLPSLSPVRLLFALLFLQLTSSTLDAQPSMTIEKVSVDSVNLSARQFFKSYMSTDASERWNAELYLLGVLDTTEGKEWCDYQIFKTITLRERMFEEFRKLDQSQLNERASAAIKRILSTRYPCEMKK